eukprot:8328197-Ditylum_brightwellii.AAC.1
MKDKWAKVKKDQEERHVYGDKKDCDLSGNMVSTCACLGYPGKKSQKSAKSKDINFIACCVKQCQTMVSEVELTLARLFSDEKAGMLKNGAVASSDIEAKMLQGMLNKDTPMKTTGSNI